MSKRFLIPALIALVVVVAVFAGCGSSSNQGNQNTANDDKTFVVGLDDSFPPMGFRDKNNEIVGFDVDLAKEVAKRLNMEPKFQVINWDTKEMELDNNKVDCIWNGLTITDERKKQMDFTKPYLENDQVVVVKKDSNIKKIGDLQGKTVGCQKGSSAYDALMADAVSKQIKDGKPVEFEENVSCFQDLDSGRIDAMVVDSVVARYYITENKMNFNILSDSLSPEQYGVAVKKGNTELRDKIQNTLDEMVKDGTAAKISEKWFGSDIIYKAK